MFNTTIKLKLSTLFHKRIKRLNIIMASNVNKMLWQKQIIMIQFFFCNNLGLEI